MRVTWNGYTFFGTLSLAIYLSQVYFAILFNNCLDNTKTPFIKGETSDEINLAIVILLLEGFPQLLILALSMIHWHGPFQTVVIDLFCTTVNVPLRNVSRKPKLKYSRQLVSVCGIYLSIAIQEFSLLLFLKF